MVFCDGACSGNPGPGGWGAVLRSPIGKIKEVAGRESPTTNNRMEIMAFIRAMQVLGSTKRKSVNVYTDSTYLIRGATQWLKGWKYRGWKTAEGKEVSNKDLWLEVERWVSRHDLTWHYVRGHAGVPGNERCDELAVAGSQGKRPALYEGPESGYEYDLTMIPEDTSLPPMREKGEKPKEAFSYLSMVGGEVVRHPNWKACEARVKGRPHTKFKKAMSSADELGILKEWGVKPDKVKDE